MVRILWFSVENESNPKLQFPHKLLCVGKMSIAKFINLQSVEISGVSNESINQRLLDVTLMILLCNIFEIVSCYVTNVINITILPRICLITLKLSVLTN